jgi:solute carrier family 6 (neurotransmitter transporter, amino acid/orphan) member 15/16/17/18/20
MTRNLNRNHRTFCASRNNEILFKHGLINNTNITHELSTDMVHQYNTTNATTWGFEECSLEKMLSDVGEGTGLAFIIFTQAICELPGSPFWAVLFFTMLLSLGLGSQIGILEGMLCTIFDIDIFKRIRKPYLTGVVCVFCFLIGLIFTTGAGEYWLKMFDSFAGTLGLVVVAFMEMIAVIYIYGHAK